MYMGRYGLGGSSWICPLFSQERASLLKECGLELGGVGGGHFWSQFILEVKVSVCVRGLV